VKHCYQPVIAILVLLLVSILAAANTPPVASFEIQPSADGSPTTLIFDASASRDPDGAIIVYGWTFGDYTTGSGITKSHTFPSIGKYTIELNVIDNGGASHLISRTIDLAQPIVDQAPLVEPAAVAVPDVVIPYNIPIGNRAGERAPAFSLPNQAGEIVQLADFLGHVVLVEFWSSSCSACQAAMPHLEELRAEFAGRGLVVITITVNRNVDGEWKYLADHGFTQFVALREAGSVDKPTMDAYGVSRIPHALIIDQQGVIRFTGHMNLVQSEDIERYL